MAPSATAVERVLRVIMGFFLRLMSSLSWIRAAGSPPLKASANRDTR
jgi:hypothetical protein